MRSREGLFLSLLSLLSLLSFPRLYGNRGQCPFIGFMQVKLQPSMLQG